MENHDRCPRCGALVLPEEKFCRQCGAALAGEGGPLYAPDAGVEPAASSGWQPGMTPRTIAQMLDYCAYNEMPLERMRFFLDQDYRGARAFGIYEDDGQYVVYKNKADGSRAVRYHGPDEAYAVNEIYAKLLDECHKRNIWPGGKPVEVVRREKRSRRRSAIFIIAIVILMVAVGFFALRAYRRTHAHDGYYRFNDEGIYYRYGDDWYYDDDYYDWVIADPSLYYDADDYDDYYMGGAYVDDWGYSDFRESETWEDLHEESHTSSSDYDSWDSGDTDWSSDW